ncbi:MAG: hypothetical protein ACRDYY_06100 [Acidimicrobiales bacterium]
MGMISNLRAVTKVMRATRFDHQPEHLRLIARRPGIAFGVGAFETGLMASGRVDARLKSLAELKTSSLIGCPF